MVNLTRIYTRLGDDGHTHLADMSRVPKTDPRVCAYADVDEANAAIGLAVAMGHPDQEIAEVLRAVQNDLFDVGADLSTPVVDEPEVPTLRVTQPYIDRLEAHCDAFLERLEPLRSFILPGGTPTAAHLHLARTVIRRAERSAWDARAEYGDAVNSLAATYLNRVSDLLFILARLANVDVGDVLWRPGGDNAPSGAATLARRSHEEAIFTRDVRPGCPNPSRRSRFSVAIRSRVYLERVPERSTPRYSDSPYSADVGAHGRLPRATPPHDVRLRPSFRCRQPMGGCELRREHRTT